MHSDLITNIGLLGQEVKIKIVNAIVDRSIRFFS